jgi:uncharacterized protein (TIGR02270 family)
MNLLWDIVEENLDEAGFVFGRWEASLSAHDQTLGDVSKWVEERLLGQLDGLRLGAKLGVKTILGPTPQSDVLGTISAAAHVMAASPAGSELLVTTFLASDGKRLQSLCRGIELSDCANLLTKIESGFKTATPSLRAAQLDMRTFRREDPGPQIAAVLSSGDPIEQAAAARAVRNVARDGRSTSPMLLYGYRVRRLETQRSKQESFWATQPPGSTAWSSCTVRHLAASPCCFSRLYLGLYAITRRSWPQRPTTSCGEIWALGFAGTTRAAEACLQFLTQDVEPKLAGEGLLCDYRARSGGSEIGIANRRMLCCE